MCSIKEGNPNYSNYDIREIIMKDCIEIWQKATIRDALPDEYKEKMRQEQAKASHARYETGSNKPQKCKRNKMKRENYWRDRQRMTSSLSNSYCWNYRKTRQYELNQLFFVLLANTLNSSTPQSEMTKNIFYYS
jgi:hypothetical protein